MVLYMPTGEVGVFSSSCVLISIITSHSHFDKNILISSYSEIFTRFLLPFAQFATVLSYPTICYQLIIVILVICWYAFWRIMWLLSKVTVLCIHHVQCIDGMCMMICYIYPGYRHIYRFQFYEAGTIYNFLTQPSRVTDIYISKISHQCFG